MTTGNENGVKKMETGKMGGNGEVARQIVQTVGGGRRFAGTEITQPYLHPQQGGRGKGA